MELPLPLQFWIALCTGLVAATLVPSIRRSIPRPVEFAMWMALLAACVVGVVNISNPHARELTTSTLWAVNQVLSTLVGLMRVALLGGLAANRFTIATCLVFVVGADLLCLAMAYSYRKSLGWQPRVRLGEWMEMPRRSAPAAEPVMAPNALDGLNRREVAASGVARAAILTWLTNHSISAKGVLVSRQAKRVAQTAAFGRVESRARLASIRDTALQLQFSARAWYVAAGVPAVSDLATRATKARRAARSGQGVEGAERTPGVMVDTGVLLSMQSIGSHGPVQPAPAVRAEKEGVDASGRPDRLAS